MSVKQTDVVDAIGVDSSSGDVILTITDHLDWGNDSKDHLLLLQEKVDTYLRFIESGELLESYPYAMGRNIVINIVGKYPLNADVEGFINHVISIVGDSGMSLRFEHF